MKKLGAKILIAFFLAGTLLAPVGVEIHKDNLIVGVELRPLKTYGQTPGSVPIINDIIISKATGRSLADVMENKYGCSGLNVGSWFTNCIVEFMYDVLFQIASALAAGAAMFMDFFLYTSITAASYGSGFIGEAWGAVRDVANIFFIVALMFVAIRTVLGMGTSENKKLFSAIIIVALLINFSLFITQVVVDASNVLARIFYHQVDAPDEAGRPLQNNQKKSISVSLVENFDPQKIYQDNTGKKNPSENIAAFAFITFMSIVLCCFMIWIFLTVAILFVARIAGLWIAMIFAPLAFASYTVAFKIPGFGHQEWWNNLLKNAFMAPIFIFFLVLIYKLTAVMRDLGETNFAGLSTSGTMQRTLISTLNIFIPFTVMFILLMQAKKLAVEYSGEMGKAFSKGAAFVGGLAIGGVGGLAAKAVLGTAAAGMRATAGRLGSKVANSERLKNAERAGGVGGFMARQFRNVGQASAKGSWDLRNTKAGAKLASSTGLRMGEGQKGGYEERRKQQKEKREKRAEELVKVGSSDPDAVALRQAKLTLANVESDARIQRNINSAKDDVDRETKKLADAERNLKDAVAIHGDGSNEANIARQARNDQLHLQKVAESMLKAAERPIKDAEKNVKTQENVVIVRERENRKQYADTLRNPVAQNIRFIVSGGQYSRTADMEVANTIELGAPKEKK